jgi:acyl dehydratase
VAIRNALPHGYRSPGSKQALCLVDFASIAASSLGRIEDQKETPAMQDELYYEDFHLGLKFASDRSVKVSAQEITEFAEKYDPQPFHLDEAAGKSSFFKGLAASGWLTAAIAMRMRVETIKVHGGMIGAGVEEIRWTEPVRPGDALRIESEVVGLRPSKKRPQLGLVTIANNTFNQRDQVVMKSTVKFLAPMRNA